MKTNVKLILLSILVVSVFFTAMAADENTEQLQRMSPQQQEIFLQRLEAQQRAEMRERLARAAFKVEVQIVEAEFDSLFPAETAPLDRKLGDITVQRLNRVIAADKGKLITAAVVNTSPGVDAVLNSGDRENVGVEKPYQSGEVIKLNTEYVWVEKIMTLNVNLDPLENGFAISYDVQHKIPHDYPEDDPKNPIREKTLDIKGTSLLRNREPAIMESVMRDGKAFFVIMTASQEE